MEHILDKDFLLSGPVDHALSGLRGGNLEEDQVQSKGFSNRPVVCSSTLSHVLERKDIVYQNVPLCCPSNHRHLPKRNGHAIMAGCLDPFLCDGSL